MVMSSGPPLCQGCAGSWAPRTCWNSLQRAALAPACATSSVISADPGLPCVGREPLCPEPRGPTKNQCAGCHRQIRVLGSQGTWMSMPAPWAWLGRDRQTEGVHFTFQEQLTQHVDSPRVSSPGSDAADRSSKLPSKGAGLQEEMPTRSLFQGTVIRVFSIPDGQKLYEFRRGVKRSVFTVCVCECSAASGVSDSVRPRGL